MWHYIEEDLKWFEQGIPGWVLVWEIEQYLARRAKRWAEWEEYQRLHD